MWENLETQSHKTYRVLEFLAFDLNKGVSVHLCTQDIYVYIWFVCMLVKKGTKYFKIA